MRSRGTQSGAGPHDGSCRIAGNAWETSCGIGRNAIQSSSILAFFWVGPLEAVDLVSIDSELFLPVSDGSDIARATGIGLSDSAVIVLHTLDRPRDEFRKTAVGSLVRVDDQDPVAGALGQRCVLRREPNYLQTRSRNQRNHAGNVQARRSSYQAGQRRASRNMSLFRGLGRKWISELSTVNPSLP